MTTVRQVISTDARRRRNRSVINRLLNWLWVNEPYAYESAWAPNIKGEALLGKIQEDFPPVYSRMLSENWRYVTATFRTGPRQIKKPLRGMVS